MTTSFDPSPAQLLAQFRTQFPDGSLTATLVSVNEGQYVVRAAVTRHGQEIATGLAASVDVQVAEDKARDRALAILGIGAESTPPPSKPSQSEPVAQQPSAQQLSEIDEVPPLMENLEAEPEDNIASLEAEEDLGPPIDSVQEEALPPTEARPSAATIALENFNTSATPVDLSDVIAQTDVELARLGWTNVQGREYLEKTYGKRSRQQLTDEELMSFLLYLEEC